MILVLMIFVNYENQYQIIFNIMKRGYYGIGIYNPKIEENIGTLWRSAFILGASFIFTIGKRYRIQPSDTPKSWKNIPLYHFQDFEEFIRIKPYDSKIIGIELHKNSIPLETYIHPERAVYLLGSEDKGLSEEIIEKCDQLIILPGNICLNVSVAGSIVLYDRTLKSKI